MIQYTLVYIAAIMCWNNTRRRHYLTRRAIVPSKYSSWTHFYNYADDNSFIEVTSMSKVCFNNLLRILFPPEDVQLLGRKRGRPPSLDNAGKLGLYLFYIGSTMKRKHLCLIFGVIPTTVTNTLSEMIPLIESKLSKQLESKIS